MIINPYSFGAPPPPLTNYALASAGSTATASSNLGANYLPSFAIDGNRVWTGSNTDYWTSANSTTPHTLEVDFGTSRSIVEIDVITINDADLSDPPVPTLSDTFSLYGATSFDLHYWDGSTWQLITSVTGNDKVWRKFTFATVSTTKIRVTVNGSSDGYGRVAELEAWG